MKQLALVLLVVFAGLFATAKQESPSCGLNMQGGPIDTFPWSVAQPFPWNVIQGLWKVSDAPDQVMRMVVVRQDLNTKHLSVEVFKRNDCSGPLMKGVGIITAAEKNVVRITLTDKSNRSFMMKLAMFDVSDLQMDKNICGQSVLAASVLTLDNGGSDYNNINPSSSVEQSNMMLKKLTNSVDFYCKKRR